MESEENLPDVVTLRYSQDNGLTFETFEELSLCSTCAERTVNCTHRQLQEVIKLPPRSTHVKVISIEQDMQNRLKSESTTRMVKLVEDVKFSLLETLTSLEDVWDDIGIKDEQKEQRHGTVTTLLQDLLSEMLAEECELKSKMQLRVEDYKRELDQLYHDLHMPPKPIPSDMTLVNLEIQLRNDVDTLTKEKHDRLKWLRRLRAEEQAICEELVMTQHEINFVGTPTLEQLRELEQNVSFLKAEKNKRSANLDKLREEVIALWKKLDTEPTDEFEKKILKHDSFILSKQNIEKVDQLKKRLETEHANLLLQIDEKRKQYKLLLDRLEQQLDASEKRSLHLVPSENTTKTLNILNKNIDNLQQFKSRHLQSFIQSIRIELTGFWDKCYFGEEQRRNFPSYYVDHYTEEILAEHEHQLNSLRHYYEDNKELFKLVSKRETIWEEKLNYDNNSEGNSRFNNRGGALMKALKKKQFIDKQLPKIETQLKNKIETWEVENESIFMYRDKRYLDFIESQKQDYETEQKTKKDEKQQAKLLESSPGLGSKVVIRKPGTVSKCSSPLKRRQPNNSHLVNGNITHSVYRSPLMKKYKLQTSVRSGPPSVEKKLKPAQNINSSKYTHSSLQSNENHLKTVKKMPMMPKLTTQTVRKSLKRRSIKACRILKEKNVDMHTTTILNTGNGKAEGNITLMSYNDFSNGVAQAPFSRSSFVCEPKGRSPGGFIHIINE